MTHRTNVYNAIEAQKYSALAHVLATSEAAKSEGLYPYQKTIHLQTQRRNWGIIARQHLLRHLDGEP